MTIWDVKLNAWASPCVIEADNMKAATELALKAYPTCDCCGEKTKVEEVYERTQPVPFYLTVFKDK